MECNTTKSKMKYRFLGNSGIQVSVLSWGNWINTKSEDVTVDTIKLALESGINFFDTAEIYGFGEGEIQLGKAFKALKVKRESIVVSTKMFRIGMGKNDGFLSRKHLMEGINGSLKRLQLDYVDVIFAHRPDFNTPLEEVCQSFDQMIRQGKAFYWGTSEWSAAEIVDAYRICDKLNLIKPIVEQCQYNMFVREKVEKEFVYLFKNYKMGTTVWSPLFSGVLSGKYINKTDNGDRFDKYSEEARLHWMLYLNNKTVWDEKLLKLKEIAEKELSCSLAQLALAWIVRNPDATTVILGTSRVEQLKENLLAIDIAEKIDKKMEKRIEDLLGNSPAPEIDWRTFLPLPKRRELLD